jgi:hypothetical protein
MSIPRGESDRAALDILIKQWDRLSQDIRTSYVLVERLITIGLALAAAVLAFKPQEPVRQHLLNVFLPVPAYGIFIYGAVLMRGVMVYAGHRQYVEEEINRIAERPLLLGQRITARMLHSTFEMFGALFTCGLVLALISANSITTACRHFSQVVTGPVTFLNFVAFVAAVYVVQKSRNTFQSSWQLSGEMAAEARRALVANAADA